MGEKDHSDQQLAGDGGLSYVPLASIAAVRAATGDLITWLWTEELVDPNSGAAHADTYFSSKGHDAPALYSLLVALGKLDFDLLHRLRRLGGLPGHPDVGTPFIAANTGSLGMGISKAYGMLRGRRQ